MLDSMNTQDPSVWNRFLYDGRIHRLVLFLLVFIVYANTINHDFVLDDGIVITENQFVKQGFAGIPSILSKDSFYGFFKKEGKDKLVAGGRYRPLSLVFFAGLYTFAGANAFLFHFFSLLWYAMLGLLLYGFLATLLKPGFGQQTATSLAFFSSLLFVLHPVHTECVANIKGLDETMALFFSLASGWFALRYLDRGNWLALLLSGAALFLGMLAKENAITYTALIPLAAFLLYGAKNKPLATLCVGLLVAALAFVWLRGSILGFNPFGGLSTELMNNPFLKEVNGAAKPMALDEKFGVISYALWEYLRLLVFPHPLTHDYYPYQIPVLGWFSWPSIAAILCYAGMIFMAFRSWKKEPLVSFAIFSYLAPLFLVSNILFPVGTNMGERFLFMPSLGYCLLFAYLLLKFFNTRVPASLWILLPVLLLYGIKTISRNPAWKDNETLFRSDLKTSANSAKIHNGMAGVLLEQVPKTNDTALIRSISEKARVELEKALRIHPLYMEAHLQMGNIYVYQKHYEGAIERYQYILKHMPDDEDAFANLQIALRERGRQIAMNSGNIPLAKEYLNRSLGMKPDDTEALMLVGMAEGSLGNTEAAIRLFERAIQIKPDHAQAYFNMGITYQRAGQLQKAEELFAQAQKLDPRIFEKNQTGK